MSITSSNVISALISYNKDRLADLNKMLYVELQDGKYYDIIYLYARMEMCKSHSQSQYNATISKISIVS